MSGEKRSIYWRGRYYRTIGELDKAFRKGRKVAIMSLLAAYAIQFPHVDITKNIRFMLSYNSFGSRRSRQIERWLREIEPEGHVD